MKPLLVSALLFIQANVGAFEIGNEWSKDLKKYLTLSCSEGETLCMELCNNELECKIEEEVCADCVANTPNMTHVFTYMGRMIVNTGELVDSIEVYDLISSGDFVSLNSKSVYNLIEGYNSKASRKRFQSLCPEYVKYPTVVFNKNEFGEIGKPKFVSCGQQIFAMSDTPNISINKSSSDLY